jgi:hypothetical protein
MEKQATNTRRREKDLFCGKPFREHPGKRLHKTSHRSHAFE